MVADKTMYHSALRSIATVYDPPIALMRLRIQKEPSLHKWPVHWFLLQFKDIKKLTKIFKDIKNINFSALPILGAAVAPLVTWLSFEVNNWVIAGSGVVLYIILFLCGLPRYFLKMLSITEEDYFHIGAYRKFCSTEYEMFSIFLSGDKFNFEGLYDYVTGVLTKQADELEIVKTVIAQHDKEKVELRKEKKDLEDKKEAKEQEIIDYYDNLIKDMDEDIVGAETGLKYFVEFLADVNNALYRIINNCFGFSDLKMISGITVYRLDRDVLYKEADEGTSGNSPEEIPIKDKNYEHYAMISVIDDESGIPKKNEPREGYFVISHKMKMKNSKGIVETWIINFHVNKELNEKAWQLLLNDGIISSKEVYRMFHALCLFLYTNYGTKKEVVDDASSTGAG